MRTYVQYTHKSALVLAWVGWVRQQLQVRSSAASGCLPCACRGLLHHCTCLAKVCRIAAPTPWPPAGTTTPCSFSRCWTRSAQTWPSAWA